MERDQIGCVNETVQQKSKQLPEAQQQMIIGHTHLQLTKIQNYKETKLRYQRRIKR